MRRSGDAGSPRDRAPARLSRAAPLALFLLVALALTAAAGFSYGVGAADLREQQEHELATIAYLKVREIVRWRDERVADASAVAVDVANELGRGQDLQRSLDQWHEALRAHREYRSIALVGAAGESLLSAGAPHAELDDPSTLALVRAALADRRATLSSVHRHAGDPALHLNVVAPVVEPGGRQLGAVILRVDPRQQFFAMVQSWPRPSETAEILLVRREDDAAVVVNELRDGAGATTVRIPLGHGDDPAVQAVSGARGIVEARDHRGRPVLAALAPVPESPWTLVAKVDAREALAPVRALRLWIGGVAAALILTAGAAAALWWRTQTHAMERARIAAEAERRALAHKLENLTRYAHDMVILADGASRIVDVNDRAAELLGYPREELIGMPVRALRDPATAGDFDARVREQIERGALMFETRYRRRDGSTFPVEVSIHTDEHEGRRYFQAIARDVTERERAAEALRASEAKFRAAFEFASLGVLLVAADGRIVETNRAFRRMLGYTEEEMRRLTLVDVHEGGDELARSLLRQMVEGSRETVDTPRRYRRKDGSVAEAILRASALRDETGAFRFALGVVEDVTDKKRLEAQLVHADRMASIGTLAAGVAHEINNPLAFILSNVEYALAEVKDAGGDGELERALRDAKDGAVRVREIVRDLRTFSRSDDDAREPLDVRQVLRSAVGLAANEIRHRAELVVDGGDVPPVVASEHRLAQVFLNLLINAAQSMPEGRVGRNVVRAATSTAPDGRALVEISDNGVGISPDVMPRIFDPFFTTRPVGVGTGLGLSICHGIVAQLGGEITVRSVPGEGTTFRVLLPAAGGDTKGPSEPLSTPPAARAARRGRVLVVDDETLVGRAVARMLEQQHEVVACTSGRAALELLAADPGFDAIVCDLMMPEMTGMELHASLLATAPELAARTIFLTGGAFTDAAAAFLERVPNPRLEKPFDRAVLREMVARVAASSSGATRA